MLGTIVTQVLALDGIGFVPFSPLGKGFLTGKIDEPIPGTTKLQRLEENIGAAALALTPDDLREIDGAASKVTVQGDRYPEHPNRMVGR